MMLSAVIYDRRKIPVGSIGGLNDSDPVTFASDHDNAILVDLSGYGLEAVLVLYFGPMPDKLPEFAADFSLVEFPSGPDEYRWCGGYARRARHSVRVPHDADSEGFHHSPGKRT